MADRITVSGDAVVTEDDSTGDVTARVDALEDASDGGTWETLKLLGYEEGDFVPLVAHSTRSNVDLNTTSSGWNAAFAVNEFLLNYSEFPSQMYYRVVYRGDPNGDTLNARLFNNADGEALPGSEYSVSGTGAQNFGNGPTAYTPTTTDSHVDIRAQYGNNDGTTEVTLYIAQVQLGLVL